MNRLLENLLFYSFFLLFLWIPLSKGFASVGFGVLIGATILVRRNWWATLKEHKALLGFSFLFIWLAIGLTYSEDLKMGGKMLHKQMALFAMPIVAIMNKEFIQKNYKHLFSLFVVGVLINCGSTWIFNFVAPDLVLFIHERFPTFLPQDPYRANSLKFGVYSPFIARIQLSNLISVAAIVTTFLFLRKHYRLYQIPILILLLLYSVSFGGRGGQLGLLFGLTLFSILVLFFYKSKDNQQVRWLKWVRWTVPIVVIGLSAALYTGYEPIQKRYQQLIWELKLYQSGEFKKYDYQHFTSLRRIVSWDNTFKLAKANPIFGVGIGDYKNELHKVYQQDDFDLPVNSHNQYLTFSIFGGLIALFIFLLSIVFWLIFLKQRDLYLFSFGLAFMGTYGIIFLFDSPLLFQVDVFLFSTLFGFIPFCFDKAEHKLP